MTTEREALIRKIEIHIETTEECMDNCNVPDYVKQLLIADNNLLLLAVEELKK